MKVLVTGAAGFIGSFLVEALTNRGDDVIGIDNINDYYDPKLKYDRLKRIKHNLFRFTKMDISNREEIAKLFKVERFDLVVHLAAQAGVRYSIENPNAYIDTNLVGFGNILEGCRHNSVKHLVYASSSSVYGMNTKMPFSEQDNVDHPVSLYAATKKANELMAHSYSTLYNIPTTGLRFFTVYGPMGRPDMAYFSFTKDIIEGRKIQIFNNGDMLRDFTYVDDVVRGIMGALDNPAQPALKERSEMKADESASPYSIMNIGNNTPEKLGYFIECIELAIGKKADKLFLPMQDGDVVATFASTESLQKLCNFKPSTPLKVGICRFVEWYKAYYKIS
jgi:UDP-glucuronate 4-epimerase